MKKKRTEIDHPTDQREHRHGISVAQRRRSVWSVRFLGSFLLWYIVCTIVMRRGRGTSRALFLPVCTVNLVLPQTEIYRR